MKLKKKSNAHEIGCVQTHSYNSMQINYIDYSPHVLVASFFLPILIILISLVIENL